MQDPEKVKRAQELYAKGYTVRQIANRIHTQYGTAKRYVDPDYDDLCRRRERKRKQRYSGTCEICGCRTSYSGFKTYGAKRCREHASFGLKKWTQERIILAIQQWAAIHGRPPSSNDWNASVSKHERGDEYPSSTSVYGKPNGAFASWADAIEAAGFPRPLAKHHGGHKELVWTNERVIAALRSYSKDGVAPKSDDWRQTAQDRPTTTWVAYRFGSWSNGCHEAGLLTYREAHPRNGKPARRIGNSTLYSEERISFVKRVTEDEVPRRFIVPQLWEVWGFKNAQAFKRWLDKHGIKEAPGYGYRPRRQLTRSELEEARALS